MTIIDLLTHIFKSILFAYSVNMDLSPLNICFCYHLSFKVFQEEGTGKADWEEMVLGPGSCVLALQVVTATHTSSLMLSFFTHLSVAFLVTPYRVLWQSTFVPNGRANSLPFRGLYPFQIRPGSWPWVDGEHFLENLNTISQPWKRDLLLRCSVLALSVVVVPDI